MRQSTQQNSGQPCRAARRLGGTLRQAWHPSQLPPDSLASLLTQMGPPHAPQRQRKPRCTGRGPTEQIIQHDFYSRGDSICRERKQQLHWRLRKSSILRVRDSPTPKPERWTLTSCTPASSARPPPGPLCQARARRRFVGSLPAARAEDSSHSAAGTAAARLLHATCLHVLLVLFTGWQAHWAQEGSFPSLRSPSTQLCSLQGGQPPPSSPHMPSLSRCPGRPGNPWRKTNIPGLVCERCSPKVSWVKRWATDRGLLIQKAIPSVVAFSSFDSSAQLLLSIHPTWRGWAVPCKAIISGCLFKEQHCCVLFKNNAMKISVFNGPSFLWERVVSNINHDSISCPKKDISTRVCGLTNLAWN